MASWLLLLLTFGCAYMTYDAFRWRQGIERTPFSTIANLWKGGLSHLSAGEQADIQKRYSSILFGVGGVPWLFLAITFFLGLATLRAFLQ